MPFSNKNFHTVFIIKLFQLVGFLLLWEGIRCETVLDVSYPILIAENRDASSTVSEGYFGYTVSLSQGIEEKSSVDPQAWIFIGAPKSDTKFRDMYTSSGTKEPGVLWRCSVGKPSGQEDSCTMMNIDPTTSPPTAKRPGNAPHFENFDGACIGGALQVNYNRLLTCGHRWQRGKSNGAGYNGVCYFFSEKEGQSSYISSDLTKLVDKSTYEHRLIPFFHSGRENALLDMQFSNLTTNLIGHEWKAGQAGISLHLFQEGSGREPNLLIGAPGVREWAGAVVFYNNTLQPKRGMERPNRNKADPTFSEFLVANRGKLFERAGQSQVRNHWGDYFGYSVSSGRYFSKDKMLYAAGAPRAQYSGEVVIFDFGPYSTSKPNSTYKREIVPVIEIQPPKNSYASYFGAELHTLELEDGLDALAVGAPMYTFRVFTDNGKSKVGEETGSPSGQREKRQVVVDEYGDHGWVIVYKFKIEPNLDKNYTSEVLFGSKIPLARFGSAISSITFELKNGTRDIYLVVGAPYEPADDGSDSTSGAVYLYKYHSQSGRFGKFRQRIVALQISPVLNGFGSSLSLPKDVDNNNTPDIAIGSYESGHVVLLRTRPKIKIKSWISYKNYEGQEDRSVRRGSKAFFIQSCVNVTETLGLLAYNADFWVKVKVSDRTISFHNDAIRRMPGNTPNEIIYKRKMFLHADQNCEELTIVPVHNAGIGMDDSDIEEIKQPFHFMQEVWYNETIDRPFSLFTYYASDGLNPNRRRQSTPERIDFHSFDHKKPAPQMTRAFKDVPISPTDCLARVCKPNVTLIWKFFNKHNEEISSYMLGSGEDVFLEIVAINSEETAVQPKLTIDWARKPSVKESVSGDRWLHRLCRNHSEGNLHLTYTCPLGQYIKRGRNVTSRIQFDMGSVFVDRSDRVDFIINGKVLVSDSDHLEEVKSKAKLSLYVPTTTVAVKGSKENETLRSPFPYSVNKSVANPTSMDRNELVLYSYFRQTFTVIVLGASVTNLVTQFKLPVQMEKDDKEPLFLVKELESGSNVNCTVTSKIGFYSIQPIGTGSPAMPSPNQIVHHEQSQFVASEEMEIKPKRRRRDVVNDSVAESNTIANDMPPPPRPSKDSKMKVDDDEILTLKCDKEGTCLELTCTVKNAKANTHIHFPFEMYTIKERIDSLLKSEGKKSILVEGFGFAHIFNSDMSMHQDDDVTQTIVTPTSTKQVELWVYVVAIISGILLLVLIVLALYKCGFFKREKREQLTNMKKEHHRKSMVAAARQSMMVQSTSADAESRQKLTDAEHQNEDADPIPEKSSKSKTKQKEEMDEDKN